MSTNIIKPTATCAETRARILTQSLPSDVTFASKSDQPLCHHIQNEWCNCFTITLSISSNIDIFSQGNTFLDLNTNSNLVERGEDI